MPAAAIIVMALVIAMLLLFGVLIKYFKCYGLISGYNTMSREGKKNIDISGLGSFMGNSLFMLAGILLIASIFNYLGIQTGFIISIAGMFLIIPYMLIGAQKYDKRVRDNKKKQRIIAIIVIGISAILFAVVAGVLINGAREIVVGVDDKIIAVNGAFGTQINMEDVEDVFLKDTIPDIISKRNGFDLGNTLRGNFSVKDIGSARLYIYRGRQPYLYIRDDKGYIIINFSDSSKTEQLYSDIEHFLKR